MPAQWHNLHQKSCSRQIEQSSYLDEVRVVIHGDVVQAIPPLFPLDDWKDSRYRRDFPRVPELVNELPDGLRNRIFAGDCAELFARLPDNSIDLILTDPPYKDYQSNRPVAREKVKKIHVNTFDLGLFIRESNRVLKPGAHFYCWCDHLTFAGIYEELRALTAGLTSKEARNHLHYKNMLVWVKNNHGSGDLKGNYAPQHEVVIYGAKGATRPLIGSRPTNVFFDRDEQGNISFYSKVSNYRFQHGTSKPLAILRQMILKSTHLGEVVLDPYGGSMSTAEAAMEEGRAFIMGELDGDHCRRGLERFAGSTRASVGRWASRPLSGA